MDLVKKVLYATGGIMLSVLVTCGGQIQMPDLGSIVQSSSNEKKSSSFPIYFFGESGANFIVQNEDVKTLMSDAILERKKMEAIGQEEIKKPTEQERWNLYGEADTDKPLGTINLREAKEFYKKAKEGYDQAIRDFYNPK